MVRPSLIYELMRLEEAAQQEGLAHSWEEAANRDDIQKEGVEVEMDVEQEEPSVEASKEEDDRNERES